MRFITSNGLREHRQKTSVMLSGFWPLSGWGRGVWVNPLKKGNLWRKSFFIYNFEIWYSVQLDIVHYEQGGGEGEYLTDKIR